MTADDRALHPRWVRARIEDLFASLHDGRTMHQGWSPQCEGVPAGVDEWGVLKTTAIQAGSFVDKHNKALPAGLQPRPGIEVSAGDILLTCAGPRSRCGVPCLVRQTRQKLMMSGKMYRFRVHDLVNPAFLEGWLLTAEAQAAIDRMKTGGNDSGLNLTHERFRELEVLVAPSREQDRIVDAIESYLSRLDAAVATLEAAQAKLKAYRASVLKAAVEGRLVPTEATLAHAEKRDFESAEALSKRILSEHRRRWEETELARLKAAGKSPKDDKWKARYGEPKPPDTKDLPDLPLGWCWVRLDRVTDIQLGQQRAPVHAAADDQLPYVRAANITWEGLDVSDVKTMGFPNPDRYRLKRGDVLLSEASGSPMEAGKPAIWRDEIPGACYQKTLLRVRSINDTLLLPEFLRLVFLRDCVTGKFARLAPGVGIVHLTAERMLVWAVPVPPFREQQRIVDEAERLESVQRNLKSTIVQQIRRVERLRHAVLKWAFEGKLVDQDLNDEPAEKLLERIRAERARAETLKRTRQARKAR